MEKYFYRLQFEAASKNWWYKGREAIVRKLISYYLKNANMDSTIPQKGRIGLDAGCGPGTNIALLQTFCTNVVAADMASEAGEFVKKRFNIPFIACDVQKLPVKKNLFDIILALDIIEHLENPDDAITLMEESLKRDGILVVTVPAFQFLWGTHDVLMWHKRRYRIPELLKKIKKTGIEILFCSYFNFFLFVPTIIAKYAVDRIFPKSVPSAGLYRPLVIHWFLTILIRLESFFFPYISFPFGTSIVCIMRIKNER